MYKVLITGTSSGLGKHLALKFEKEGYSVFRHNGRKHYDLCDKESVLRLANDAKGVSILINNAAIACPGKELSLYSDNEIVKMISVNLIAPILLTHCLLSSLTNIININSMVGLEIKKLRTLYSATKWGLRGFSQSLKAENKNISVLDVYSTNIKTSPNRENALDLDFVVDSIFNAFIDKKQELILDGRK